MKHFYLFLSLLLVALLHDVTAQPVQEMTPQDFKAAIDAGLFDVVVDVRSEDEFATEGHIEGATLVADLASTGTPEAILACQDCTLGVYCSAGTRARGAIRRLINEYGFPPENLFNGQGISQWTAQGYPVVATPSVEAFCNTPEEGLCRSKEGDRPTVVQEMTAPEFREAMDNGRFDVVIDIRRQDEWDAGHIANVTFVTNLASDGVIDNLAGCANCTVGLYCRTGNRVRSAIGRLTHEFGFRHDNLYNGLGVSQWTEAGYGLVTGESVPAECQADPEYQCKECCKEETGATMSDGGDMEGTDMATDSSGNSTMEGDEMMESVEDEEDTESTPSAAPLRTVAASLFSVSFGMVASLLS